MNWISVKDQWPMDGQWILCIGELYKTRHIFVAQFLYGDCMVKHEKHGACRKSCFMIRIPDGKYALSNVTHWMPLPEMPNEEI
jgi:hypothetical protein